MKRFKLISCNNSYICYYHIGKHLQYGTEIFFILFFNTEAAILEVFVCLLCISQYTRARNEIMTQVSIIFSPLKSHLLQIWSISSETASMSGFVLW